MILKCAQHIRLPEHSHPPKLIKSYIAISCLIKATLCLENPAQLSNGCYSMKADCICLRDIQRGKENPHILCHILNTHTQATSPMAREDQRQPRWAEAVLYGGVSPLQLEETWPSIRLCASSDFLASRFHSHLNWLCLGSAWPNCHFSVLSHCCFPFGLGRASGFTPPSAFQWSIQGPGAALFIAHSLAI